MSLLEILDNHIKAWTELSENIDKIKELEDIKKMLKYLIPKTEEGDYLEPSEDYKYYCVYQTFDGTSGLVYRMGKCRWAPENTYIDDITSCEQPIEVDFSDSEYDTQALAPKIFSHKVNAEDYFKGKKNE